MGRGGVRWGWWGAAADRLDVDVGDDELVGGEAEAVLDVPLRVPPKHRHADDLRAARTHHTARRTTRAPHAAHRAPHTARTQKGFNQRGHPGMTYVPTMPALCPIPQRGREGEGIGGIEREGKGKGRGGAGRRVRVVRQTRTLEMQRLVVSERCTGRRARAGGKRGSCCADPARAALSPARGTRHQRRRGISAGAAVAMPDCSSRDRVRRLDGSCGSVRQNVCGPHPLRPRAPHRRCTRTGATRVLDRMCVPEVSALLQRPIQTVI